MDCDRYPDSPFCGGNPINLAPIGFEISLVQDECNFGIEFNTTLAFIKLPPFQIVIRNPNCTYKPPEPITRVPQPPPDIIENPVPQCNFGVWINNFLSEIYEEEYITGTRDVPAKFYGEKHLDVTRIYYPLPTPKIIPNNGYPRNANLAIDVNYSYILKSNSAYLKNVVGENGIVEYSNTYGDIDGKVFGDPREDSTEWERKIKVNATVYYAVGTSATPEIVIHSQTKTTTGFEIPYCSFAEASFFNRQVNRPFIGSTVYSNGDYKKSLRIQKWYFVCPNQSLDPPPPPKKECCKMPCCPDNSNLERLLRLILKKIGSENLPATVPVSLTRSNSGTLQIQSLAEYFAYSVKQTNAQFGQFPQEIKIQDADLTQEGNQEKTIKLPNLAESIAEIVGILLILQSESNANLIATVNSMIEAGSAKQAASLAVDYSKANSEYLGYKGKQIEHKLPFTFKPGESRLDKMLVSGEVSVKGFENDDKDDLNDALAPLLELAAMWKAANFKNLGTSNTLEKLRSALKGAVDISKAVDDLVKTPPPQDPNNPTPPPAPKKSDWDTFLEQAEQGFIAQPGITDPTNPYSRPLDQRPKIREIGNDTSDTSSSGQ
ncbi:hypothetical protein [Halotia branconii]|uniref:Uncharacterized protein n=1 Tax=Halotia branconii CENA392 TaxID=1539056 RepID=A0AAJ6NSU5_9CYAN|nr:hypothetical protein [Halotia branconii]WGV25972.1 hypothetical protein QI031_00150 [Halotia branconii CENA392]